MVDTITIYPHKFKKQTFQKTFERLKRKPKSVAHVQEVSAEEELAQEKKKYMEVSGLADLQELMKQRRELPPPKKKEIEEELVKRLESGPKVQEQAG